MNRSLVRASKFDKKKECLIHVSFLLVLFCIVLFRLDQYDMPASTTDELGYLSFPAQVVGLDWTDIMQYTNFYSKGYGILLIPFYMLFPSQPWIVYKLAIVLNLVLLCGCYFVCNYCAKELFPELNTILRFICCFILMLYPSNLFYAHVALPEVLLYLLFWMGILFLIKFENTKKSRWLLCFSATIGYMMIVHQRTIGVFIAAILLGVFLFFTKDISIKNIALILIILSASVIIWNVIRISHYDYIGGVNDLNQSNVSVFKAGSIVSIIFECLKNLDKYVFAVLGRVYYFLVVGNIPFFFGAIYVFRMLYQQLKKMLKGETRKYLSVYLFIILAVLLTIAEAATGGVAISRLDTPVYGRYIENVMGPVILCGLCNLISTRKYISKIIIYLLSVLAISPIVLFMMNQAKEITFSIDSAVGFGAFFDRNMQGENCFKRICIIVAIVFIISIIITILLYLKKKNVIIASILLMTIGVFWFGIFAISHEKFYENRIEIRNKYIDNILPVLDGDENAEIVYIRGKDPNCIAPKYIQFLVPNRKIRVIDLDKVMYEDISNNCFVITYSQDEAMQILDDSYQLLCTQYDVNIYKKE